MGEMKWLLPHEFSACLKGCAACEGCAGAGLQEAAALLHTVLRDHLQPKKKKVLFKYGVLSGNKMDFFGTI